MKKWYNIELFEGYVTNKLTVFLKKEGIKYEVSDCTPVPKEVPRLLHFEIYIDEIDCITINDRLDFWFENMEKMEVEK